MWDDVFITGTVCAGFVLFFALLFGTLVLMRWFRHKEALAMIEQGMVPAHVARPRNGKGILIWGIALTALGLALLCGLLSVAWTEGRSPGDFVGPATAYIFPGLISLSLGIAFVVIYLVLRVRKPDEQTVEPRADRGREEV